jgi:hypothetical protein
MRDCPSCGAAVDGLTCKACGHVERAGVAASLPQGYDERIAEITRRQPQCAHTVRGMQCAKIGTISPATTGDGPWFCADHMPGLSRPSQHYAPPHGFESLRALTHRVAPVPQVLDVEGVLERTAIQGEGA